MDAIGTKNRTTRRRSPAVWTREKIEEELKDAVNELGTTSSSHLAKNGYRNLVDAVKRHYGKWNAGLVALGYEVAYKYQNPDDNLTKEETKEKVLKALETGSPPTRDALEKYIPKLRRSIKANFDSMAGLKQYCGFCSLSDKPATVVKKSRTYRPILTSAEGVKREIIRMWYISAPMNYSYVKKERKHLVEASNRYIGSWKKAVESTGIKYKDVSKSYYTNTLSECGTEFERVFSRVLSELGYEFDREGEATKKVYSDFKLKPDFVLPNWHWIDCKLSEWTDVRETVIRYYDEKPNGITIVYLRGRNRKIKRGVKWKYDHISVYQITKHLPEDKQRFYEKELKEIENKADRGVT